MYLITSGRLAVSYKPRAAVRARCAFTLTCTLTLTSSTVRVSVNVFSPVCEEKNYPQLLNHHLTELQERTLQSCP